MKIKLKKILACSLLFCIQVLLVSGCKSDDGGTNPAEGLPILTTAGASSITATSAVSGGNITSDGGSAVTVRGICWGKYENPTTADSKSTDGQGTGSFVSNITGLTPHTTYYFRAYATNNSGTGYGGTLTFTAQNPPATYFGHAVPGETPELFASDILNPLSVFVEATELSPDGTLFFAAVGNADYTGGKLYYSKLVNNVWTPFAEPAFTTGFQFSNEPVFSADGSTLFFTGRKTSTDKVDLWRVTYTNQIWDVPEKLPYPIDSDANDFRASFMTDGTLYFSSNRTGGMNQIYKGTIQPPAAEILSTPINTLAFEGDPCIAPDGHFIIFHSGRNGMTSTDLFVSFSDGHGGWKTPISLGAQFNTSNDEYGAHLSSNGKYLFFTRHTGLKNSIYWVAVSAIENLRQ